MRLPDRLILIGTLAQSLWMMADGVRCLVTGQFQAPTRSAAEAMLADGVIVELSDGRLVEYGPWALIPDALGIHPHVFAPLFVGLGFAGLIALLLYLLNKPMGWHAVLAFSVASIWYAWLGTALAVLVIAMLVLPSVRRERLSVPPPTA